MEQKKDVFARSRAVEDMHHLRLMSLLQELERDHGRKKAAAMLGVDRRTLDASLDDGVLSRRMRGVLDKALQYGLGSAATEQRDRNDKLEDRVGELETGLEALGKEVRANNRAREDGDQGHARGDGAGVSEGRGGGGRTEDGARGPGRRGGQRPWSAARTDVIPPDGSSPTS